MLLSPNLLFFGFIVIILITIIKTLGSVFEAYINRPVRPKVKKTFSWAQSAVIILVSFIMFCGISWSFSNFILRDRHGFESVFLIKIFYNPPARLKIHPNEKLID